jgi:hypothetical protein
MITKAYFILGSGYVRYDAGADAVDPSYPKPIAGNWSGFSEIGFQDGIDAAVEWPNGKAYFFKGALYARYDIAGNRIELGYPLSIGDQWAGLAAAGFAEGIDAAVNWGNGKVYFFKGDQYVRYDIAADQTDDGFPVHISDGWAGFAAAGFDSGLDTAVNWGNGKAYFFKGGLYLRYDIAADQMDDGYPQPISSGWPTLAAVGFGSNIAATWTRTGSLQSTDFSYLSNDFFVQLKQTCGRLRCAPEDLLGVMESESSVQPSAQNPKGNATGLIQFMPDTLKGLGWTAGPDEFKGLTAEQQLPFVERYFAPHISQGLTSACAVTRRRLSSGCKPRPATAPAGSNWGRHGGDEMSEAPG